MANGVVKIQPNDRERTSEHLSRPFVYFFKRVWLELIDENGASRQWQTTIVCVDDWNNSPFTSINPDRTFLLGRSVLFKLITPILQPAAGEFETEQKLAQLVRELPTCINLVQEL